MTMLGLFLCLVLVNIGDALEIESCDCENIEIVTSDKRTIRKQRLTLGTYSKVEGVQVGGKPVWLHQNEDFFLYFSNHSSYWAVGQTLGGDVVRLENRGTGCPDQLTSSWRFANGGEGSLVYDHSLKLICPDGPCGREICGNNARCDKNLGHCVCQDNYEGNPQDRCFPRIGSLCSCKEISLTSTNPNSIANQKDSFGKYFLYGASNGYPVYQHETGLLYLYQQDGSWLISNQIGSRSGGIQNQGDPSMCPYRFKTAWEYADVSKPGWQWSYDYNASMVCAQDGCSMTKCGQRATCTDQGGEGTCSCDIGFDGNPYERCFPVEVPRECPCTKLSVQSSGDAAKTQSDKMGKYYLFGYYEKRVVYQHESGLEYLFHAHGQAWAIGAAVGGLRVGVINFSNNSCPYKVETPWKHSTKGKLDDDPKLSLTCDRSSIVQNPIVTQFSTLETLPPVQSTTELATLLPQETNMLSNNWLNNEQMANAIRALDEIQKKLNSNQITLLAPPTKNEIPETTNVKVENKARDEATTENGIHSVPTGTKGIISAAQLEERPTKITDLKIRKEESIPESFFDRISNDIYNEDENSFDQESGESIKVYFFSTTPNPTNNEIRTQRPKTRAPNYRTPRTPSPRIRSPLQKILPRIPTVIPHIITTVRSTTAKLAQFLDNFSSKVIPKKRNNKHKQNLHPAYTSLPIEHNNYQVSNRHNTPKHSANKNFESFSATNSVTKSQSLTNTNAALSDICNCSKIIITSNNPTTISKHAKELGQYSLVGELSGRPVYKHVSRSYYLYYQQESGGNWLVNTKPGLLFGGMQNSKDFPVCPYLLTTVWQYGDSEVGGWVYDPSLKVTCPSHPCSIIKCGFRAECQVMGDQAICMCRDGFSGDPYNRCYPQVQDRCSCKNLLIDSSGQSRIHQRDKMGDYFLWGYYNSHPVYQHYSGLDFLYFHRNEVWGVGPKVGGKRAGLLNFGSAACPYEVSTPWQFGTKEPNNGRQLDTHLVVSCTS
eukprot:TRINITY_DN31854_c0_g1_i1.p1 TRINITY_DN31854_c0_g1~~TRINITY_DN31854_c0_g1_i1.p1  ORF type:complete len:998 (-),score=131.89 TRINITY_DN31854_c0_g1_i1:38-3031(-)